jgi:hypothetical protein
MESATKRSTGARMRPDSGGEPGKTTFFLGEGGWDRPPNSYRPPAQSMYELLGEVFGIERLSGGLD